MTEHCKRLQSVREVCCLYIYIYIYISICSVYTLLVERAGVAPGVNLRFTALQARVAEPLWH